MTDPIKPVETPVVPPVADPNPIVDPNPVPPVAKTADEIEAEAKVLEAELAELEGKTPPAVAPEDKKLADQTKRKQIAQDKIDAIKNSKGDVPEISIDDRDAMLLEGIKPNSDKAKILLSYVNAGKCANIDEALKHVGAKAEIEALEAVDNAKHVIDENDTEEVQLKTKKEAVAAYKKSGEFPDDPEMRKAITESNLADMDL